jgi:hypothetical protein
MMPERFVIVHRTYDPLQADLLGDLLRDAGVFARVTGTRSAALVGVGQNVLEVHLAVPESQAAQATDFIEAYLSASVEEAPDPAAGADEAEDAEEQDEEVAGREPEIRPLLAAGSAFLTFGVGHLYARRPATAAALLAGQLVAMAFLFMGDTWYEWTVGMTALIAIVGCDVVGGVLAARAHRSGVRRGRAWQSALGAVYGAGAHALAHALGPYLTDPTRGDPTGGVRQWGVKKDPADKIGRPLERDPSFPPLTSQHPANPSARH